MNLIVFLIPFLFASLFSGLAKTEKGIRTSSLVFSIIGSAMLFVYALPFALKIWEKQVSDWWMIDSFSALNVLLVAFVYLASVLVALRYVGHEHEERLIDLKQYRLFFVLFHLFALSMLITLLANSSLLLWLALEGTTLFSTFLVGLYRKRTSIEAAWKYMIICTTGISLGLVGILLLSYGAHVSGIEGGQIFLLSSLAESAEYIPENIIKLSFVFIFIGFGTKVGLAPLHNWLPDAHSKAPSPVSAIFSAVLLNVALYAILRFKFIADSAFFDSTWTNNLFLIFGFISVALSALMMLIQVNYKRMLAYSSIEHMGLILFSLALSPVSAVFGLMHLIGHTLTKSSLFFGAGEILIKTKTTKASNLKDMFARAKYTSILFVLGILGIVAMPFSVLFVSEYGMLSQAIILYPKTALALFVFLGVIAYAMLRLTMSMLLAKKKGESIRYQAEKWNLTHSIIAFELCLVFILSFVFTSESGYALVQAIATDILFIK
jgi:hydrogenase-4 component F